MSYADAGHRPHGIHHGEEPQNLITYGPESISVRLDTWGPREDIFPTIYDALQANWGDTPSRTIDNHEPTSLESDDARSSVDEETGWMKLLPGQRAYVESCFAGKTLPQILELISFEFTIDGVTRAFTHQTVRTRVGAAFMQHGGRDNDWRHRPWTMPETIRRACEREEGGTHTPERQDLLHCIKDWRPIKELEARTPCFDGYPSQQAMTDNGFGIDPTLRAMIQHYLMHGREIYAALVDAGIPWQDARRLLWMGTQTYIHEVWNYLALQSMLAKRLEFIMDWEHVCVAQLMVREVNMKCPPIFGKYLRSLSDRLGRAAFAGLESWTPDGKYPVEDTLPRTHRPEQNPFWVLHPDALAGGPIKWIPTNGVYPTKL